VKGDPVTPVFISRTYSVIGDPTSLILVSNWRTMSESKAETKMGGCAYDGTSEAI
jgi:hypothetical protein